MAGLIEAEKSYQRELTESLTALAVVIARKIVERELTTDPDTVTTLVHTVVAQFPMDQSVKIRLNPDDLAHIVESAEAGVEGSEFAAIREIRWVPDDSVVHGGCVVEGPDRVVDGRVDRALERLFWAVKDA